MYFDFGIKNFSHLKIVDECNIALEEYHKMERYIFSVSLSPVEVSSLKKTKINLTFNKTLTAI